MTELHCGEDQQQYRVLTQWEVEEFLTEVQQRRSLWMGKELLWVRRQHGENQFAMKFVGNATVPRSYTLFVKTLNTEPHETHERYVTWLLSKFCSYGERKNIELYLTAQVGGVVDRTQIEQMALRLSGPGGVGPKIPKEPTDTPILIPPVEVQIEEVKKVIVPRSKYLQKLLRKT